MGPPIIVALEVVIEHRLHLLDGFKPGAPSLDPEILVEQGAVVAFKDAGRATLSFVVIVVVFRVRGLCRNAIKPASMRSGHRELGAQTLTVRARFCR